MLAKLNVPVWYITVRILAHAAFLLKMYVNA